MNTISSQFVTFLAQCTRWMQARYPYRPLKGLTRFSNLINRVFPPYRGTIQILNGVNFHVDSRQSAERWLLFSGNYQPAVTNALKQHTPIGGVCMDIGANLGFYTVSMSSWVGSSGHVIAFEANPKLVERINQNIALNQFAHATVESVAVHNESGTVEFYLSASPGKSSIHLTDRDAEKLTVPAITLDDYCDTHPLSRLDVIKLDIEGNDCYALLGARKMLTQFRPFIVFEFKRTTPPEIAKAAIDLLTSLNYQIQSLSTDGSTTLFDLQTAGTQHTDIVCIP